MNDVHDTCGLACPGIKDSVKAILHLILADCDEMGVAYGPTEIQSKPKVTKARNRVELSFL